MAAPCSLRFFLTIVLVSFFVISKCDELDEFEGARTLVLEHSFQTGSGEQFSKRGTITIQSLKGNRAHFSAVSSLSESEIELLRESAQSNGLYKVRIPVKGSGEGASPSYVSSSTLSCGIIESGLRDEITVSFDQSGEVLGVSIRPKVSGCANRDVPDSNLSNWHTAVEVTTTVAGPSPDTQTYIDRMKRDEQEKMKNQDGDNRSFFGKYWMYIVPVVVMMVIMSSADQQQGGGGGGGGR